MSNLSPEDVAAIDARFRSGNSVPVERSYITASEWSRIKQLADAVNGAPVVPLTEQISYPPHGVIPLDWNEPCFKTTYARVLRCDKDGRLVPDGGEG